MTTQAIPMAVCLYRTLTSRHVKKYKSSRASHSSPILRLTQPLVGSITVRGSWLAAVGLVPGLIGGMFHPNYARRLDLRPESLGSKHSAAHPFGNDVLPAIASLTHHTQVPATHSITQ